MAVALEVAGLEQRVLSRSALLRWAVLAFAFLALATAYLGTTGAGVVAFQGFTRTAASLLSLSLTVLPLVALSLAGLRLGEEPRAWELLVAHGAGRRAAFLGRLLGCAAALVATVALGFGSVGLFLGLFGYSGGWTAYAVLGFAAMAASLTYLALGAWVASLVRDRLKAVAIGIGLWMGGVLLYDLVVTGVIALVPPGAAGWVLLAVILLNPADLVRTAGLFALGAGESLGPTGFVLLEWGPLREAGWPAVTALLVAAAAGWGLLYAAAALGTVERSWEF